MNAESAGGGERRRPIHPGKLAWGAVLIVLGGWLLVNTLGLLGFWWSNSWPLILIAIGLVQFVEPSWARIAGPASGRSASASGAWSTPGTSSASTGATRGRCC
jgi:hypothetical protein